MIAMFEGHGDPAGGGRAPRDGRSPEPGPAERAERRADGLEPLPPSIAESMLSLLMEPRIHPRPQTPLDLSAEPDPDRFGSGSDGEGGGDWAEPQSAASAEFEAGKAESHQPGSAVAHRSAATSAGALEPVPASISNLLSSVCAEIQSELADNESISQSFDALDRGLLAVAGRMPNIRNAHGVETVVELERGRWTVDVVVIFPDGLIRHRVDSFHTRARAEISAELITRAAERELRGPFDA